MEYELAKQLKVAGFPQTNSHWYFSDHTQPATLWCINALEKVGPSQRWDIYAAPTLEELIAACEIFLDDPRFRYSNKQITSVQLKGGRGVWLAKLYGSGRTYVKGSTPVVAAANLYLALNPKKA